MTDEKTDRGKAIRDAIGVDGSDESQSESPEQSQTQVQSESQSQSQTQSQTQSVMESLGIEDDEEDLKTSRKHVNMYLDESLAEALDQRFSEVSALNKKQHGYELEKNRDFYPALVEAAFRGDESILDVLGLEPPAEN